MDPPDHTRLRRMLIPDFTFRRVEELRPSIQQLANGLIDDLLAKHPAGATVDLVEHFTLPLPLLVICELLGVPYTDREFIHQQAAAFATVTAGPEAMRAGWAALFGYLCELLADKSRRPGDDLLSRLATERVATGEATAAEAAGMTVQLLIAGHETTAGMLSLGVVTLLTHPTQLSALRADPELVPGAVEELLRYLTVVHIGMRRIATEDVELGGVTIRAAKVRSSPSRPPTATRRPSPTPTPSTSPAMPVTTSRSDTACTTASASRWPGPNCRSRCPRC